MSQPGQTEPIIDVTDLRIQLSGRWILNGINLTVYPGEIIAIVGNSGAGKSTLLRTLIGLQPFSEGCIHILNHNTTKLDLTTQIWLQRHWGILFQQSALFSSMTVLENVSFPLQKHTQFTASLIEELALLKIAMTGLPPHAATQYPAELSGGMQKRAGLARALALDPLLLFLDEPTAGLDPQGANSLDDLVLNLRSSLNLTMVIVTHDLDTLWRLSDRVAFLADGKLIAVDTMSHLTQSHHPVIKNYFSCPRARLAQAEYVTKRGMT